MSWTADQIYSIPDPMVIEHLRKIEGFSDELFVVTDLEGIRHQHTRDFMLSNQKKNDTRKHGLPDKGLLVVKPTVYKTGYDKDYLTNPFWTTYKKAISDKWDFIDSVSHQEIDWGFDMDFSSNQLKLLSFLKSMNAKYSVPFLYYFCETGGGYLEKEYAIVFSNPLNIYMYDMESKKTIELTHNEKVILGTTVLQIGFRKLDLELPTGFFALHQASFDWKRYHI